MSDDATSWARAMGRELNLKPATRFVLFTLANDAGTRDAGFIAYQSALAADTGMSISSLKSHLALLRKAQLVIAGDPRMVQHIEAQKRPSVYRLNFWITVEAARRNLDPVDNSADSPEFGPPESGDRQNLAIRTPESRQNAGSQILATQTPESSRSGSQNLATNPLRGLYGGTNGPRRNKNTKTKANDDGKRLCMECTVRKPLSQMIQRDGGGFICDSHLTD